MKESYEKSPQKCFRIIVTVQNGTDIKTSNLWISREMLKDTLMEEGMVAFRRKIRESLQEQMDWAAFEIHDHYGHVPPVRTKKPWWKKVFGG